MLESLTTSSVQDADRDQIDSTENRADPPTTVSTQPIVPSNTLTPDTVDSTVINDNESEQNPTITDMDHETTPSQPVPSTSGVTSIPKVPPRRERSSRKGSSSVKPLMNTLDSFVTKDSPSCKRKPSGDAGSPSSIQNMKSSRTDGADSVS